MIRHYAITAWRHLDATRLLSAIAILGLALGLTGALLMSLVVRSAVNYNRFMPDYDRIYLGVSALSAPGNMVNYSETSNGGVASLIRLNLSDVEAVARLAEEEVDLVRGVMRTKKPIYWADPDIFDLLRLPVVRGDLSTALQRPDGVVMTEASARRLFGRADAVGEAIKVGGRQMTLRAVVADFPPGGTDLANEIFASGRAEQSSIARFAVDGTGQFSIGMRTYMRLRRGADPSTVESRLAPLVDTLVPRFMRDSYKMQLVRIDHIALNSSFHPGARERLVVGMLVAALVLFIAIANFVNLNIALMARRRREIGIRKASGANRTQIIVQFLAETIVAVIVAALLAAAASEWLLPLVNAYLDTNATFDYLTDPSLMLWLLLAAIALGLLAGAYPAFKLSGLSPARTLQGNAHVGGGRTLTGQALVASQFAILIGLIIVTATVYRQRQFAMTEALRLDTDQTLIVEGPCPTAFREQVANLAEVRATACTGKEFLTGDTFGILTIGNRRVSADLVSLTPSAFALFGIKPIAGATTRLPAQGETTISRVVINQTAVRPLGFTSPQAAIGQIVPVPSETTGPDQRARIVAVVPDFALHSIERAIKPTIYINRRSSPYGEGIVAIKLAGNSIPESLAAIDRIWSATGNSEPINRYFVSEHIEKLYRRLTRDTQLFAIFAGLAIFLACLGLIGLAVSTADRRTKEIGVRKAMGASTGQVTSLLLWQLSRPVLLANLLAWPVSWWLLDRWLSGYAYHVAMPLWIFPMAGAVALALALATVGAQTYSVASQNPVRALRYE